MAERRDFDDIKLIASAEEPLKIGAGVSPQDLADLDSDLLGASSLDSTDLSDDLLDDLGELSATATRPKKRKSSSLGLLVTILMLVVFGGGAGYAYLNKDVLMPMVMDMVGGKPAIKPAPGDLPEVTTGPALPPNPTPAPAVPSDTAAAPMVPAVTSLPADGATPPSVPAVPTVPVVSAEPPPMDVGFSDGLPQPEALENKGAPADVLAIEKVETATGKADTTTSGAVVKPTTPNVGGSSAKQQDSEALTVPSVPAAPTVPTVPEGGVAKPDDSKLSAPSGVTADADGVKPTDTDVGNLKMPNLPDVEKSMGGDDFIESKNTLDELSDMTGSKLNLSPEQKAAGLGVSVSGPKTAVKKDATATKAPVGSATSTTSKSTASGTAYGMPGIPSPTTSTASGAKAGGVSDPATLTAPEVKLVPEIEEQIAAADRALDLERYPAALEMFTALYKANPRDERILMGRAIALQKLGRTDEAIGAYDELIAVSPDSPDALINALGLVRQKNPQDALSRLMDLRQKYPTNATIAAQIGLVNAELKNYDEGLKFLNIAADLESTNPKHFFNMAVIAERMGRVDLAIDYYERTLKADALSAGGRNKIDRDMIYDRLSYLRQGTATTTP